MQHIKLLGMLATSACLVIGTIASAEPVSPAPPKKHAECQETKQKTACNHAADVRELLAGRQAPSTSGPNSGGPQTPVFNSRQDLQSAKDASGETQPPK
jgi:hypothetical protein